MLLTGVILGNYRCSKAGLDLNRQWQKPSKRVTPTVHALKNLLRANQNRVVFYCDLHGHSRKYDSFMYGCKNQSHRRERMVPWLLGQIEPFFSYNGSSFKVCLSSVVLSGAQWCSVVPGGAQWCSVVLRLA